MDKFWVWGLLEDTRGVTLGEIVLHFYYQKDGLIKIMAKGSTKYPLPPRITRIGSSILFS